MNDFSSDNCPLDCKTEKGGDKPPFSVNCGLVKQTIFSIACALWRENIFKGHQMAKDMKVSGLERLMAKSVIGEIERYRRENENIPVFSVHIELAPCESFQQVFIPDKNSQFSSRVDFPGWERVMRGGG